MRLVFSMTGITGCQTTPSNTVYFHLDGVFIGLTATQKGIMPNADYVLLRFIGNVNKNGSSIF
jgi:hypothetical protein